MVSRTASSAADASRTLGGRIGAECTAARSAPGGRLVVLGLVGQPAEERPEIGGGSAMLLRRVQVEEVAVRRRAIRRGAREVVGIDAGRGEDIERRRGAEHVDDI